jgi:hypothetical protein
MIPPVPDRVKQVLAGTRSIQDLPPDEQRLALELAAAPHTTPNDAIEAIYAALPSTKGATDRRRRAEPS